MNIQEPEKIANAWEYWYEKNGQVEIWIHSTYPATIPFYVHVKPFKRTFGIDFEDKDISHVSVAETTDEVLARVAYYVDFKLGGFYDFFNAQFLDQLLYKNDFELCWPEREYLIWKLDKYSNSYLKLS